MYGLGQLGETEGRIYEDWQIIDEIPFEARLERRWLDFGFTNDFSAIGNLYYYNGGYIYALLIILHFRLRTLEHKHKLIKWSALKCLPWRNKPN